MRRSVFDAAAQVLATIHRPVAGGEAEPGESGEVDRGGEQGEVGGDLGPAADPGTAAAVAPSRHRIGTRTYAAAGPEQPYPT
jgi:hypothetical protein